MSNINEVISILGGDVSAAYHLQVTFYTIQYWRKADKIPQKYWKKIREFKPEVSLEMLAG